MGRDAFVKLLLDTRVWLWSLLAPENLSRRVAAALENAENELRLSPISVWELVVLAEKGRVALDRAPDAWVAEAMSRASLREALLTHEIALYTDAVRLPHRDPADRFLVATAIHLDLTLVTADQHIIGAKACRVLANR